MSLKEQLAAEMNARDIAEGRPPRLAPTVTEIPIRDPDPTDEETTSDA